MHGEILQCHTGLWMHPYGEDDLSLLSDPGLFCTFLVVWYNICSWELYYWCFMTSHSYSIGGSLIAKFCVYRFEVWIRKCSSLQPDHMHNLKLFISHWRSSAWSKGCAIQRGRVYTWQEAQMHHECRDACTCIWHVLTWQEVQMHHEWIRWICASWMPCEYIPGWVKSCTWLSIFVQEVDRETFIIMHFLLHPYIEWYHMCDCMYTCHTGSATRILGDALSDHEHTFMQPHCTSWMSYSICRVE